jgi:thiol-disulfide isomerase/thioredoxin
MPATPSTMLDLGTPAPQFRLRDATGAAVSSDQFVGFPFLVAFLCPHCPFVKHVRAGFAQFANEYQGKGLAIVAINSNDLDAFPDDGPVSMKKEMEEGAYTFPYLIDSDQSIAKAFRAACTPDFFLFDSDHKLVYRGQFDASRPGNEVPVTGSDLRAAADALLAGQTPNPEQRPSIGCNIKWKKGAEPDYFSAS